VSVKPTQEQLVELLRDFPTWGHAAVHYKAELGQAREREKALREKLESHAGSLDPESFISECLRVLEGEQA